MDTPQSRAAAKRSVSIWPWAATALIQQGLVGAGWWWIAAWPDLPKLSGAGDGVPPPLYIFKFTAEVGWTAVCVWSTVNFALMVWKTRRPRQAPSADLLISHGLLSGCCVVAAVLSWPGLLVSGAALATIGVWYSAFRIRAEARGLRSTTTASD